MSEFPETLPVEVRNITIFVYDHQMKPSCYKKKVNVVMPGFFVIKGGEVDTSRDFDVVKDGAVSVSVSLDGDHICLNGHSDMFIVPDSLWSVQSALLRKCFRFQQLRNEHLRAGGHLQDSATEGSPHPARTRAQEPVQRHSGDPTFAQFPRNFTA